jgi:hypothetical protein
MEIFVCARLYVTAQREVLLVFCNKLLKSSAKVQLMDFAHNRFLALLNETHRVAGFHVRRLNEFVFHGYKKQFIDNEFEFPFQSFFVLSIGLDLVQVKLLHFSVVLNLLLHLVHFGSAL